MLKGRNILVGLSGGIAAYKVASLIRLLVKEGASVKVIMTPCAKEFITPLTLATLSQNPVLTEFYNSENGDWNSHIELGLWADLYVIAPATANTIAKMAGGIADNLLLTTYLSARCPVLVAPSMDTDMLMHPSAQKNIETLKSYGNHVLEPAIGELASGLSGKGRMTEPEEIVKEINNFFTKKKNESLKGKRVLVNAGPTHESLDPVRYIGNHSSGKMGIAIADAAADAGADVCLVLGPVNVTPKNRNVKVVNVTDAKSMTQECTGRFPDCDIAVLAAAVADFTPVTTALRKLKRNEGELTIKLKPTTDIAASLGRMKRSDQLLAGFALETDDVMENAQIKLRKKNLDLIVVNSLRDKGAGFGHDTNKITIIDRYNNIDKFELKSKEHAAADIIAKIAEMINC